MNLQNVCINEIVIRNFDDWNKILEFEEKGYKAVLLQIYNEADFERLGQEQRKEIEKKLSAIRSIIALVYDQVEFTYFEPLCTYCDLEYKIAEESEENRKKISENVYQLVRDKELEHLYILKSFFRQFDKNEIYPLQKMGREESRVFCELVRRVMKDEKGI